MLAQPTNVLPYGADRQFAPEAEKGADLANFLGFAEVAVFQLWSHHHFEEESWFPAMQKVAPNVSPLPFVEYLM